MENKDGGSAFPQLKRLNATLTDTPDFNAETIGGMTLLDYFAGQALIGIIISGNKEKDSPVGTDLETFNAHLSYKQAQAMLKVKQSREKG